MTDRKGPERREVGLPEPRAEGLGDVIFVPPGVTWEEYEEWLVAVEKDPDIPPPWGVVEEPMDDPNQLDG